MFFTLLDPKTQTFCKKNFCRKFKHFLFKNSRNGKFWEVILDQTSQFFHEKRETNDKLKKWKKIQVRKDWNNFLKRNSQNIKQCKAATNFKGLIILLTSMVNLKSLLTYNIKTKTNYYKEDKNEQKWLVKKQNTATK